METKGAVALHGSFCFYSTTLHLQPADTLFHTELCSLAVLHLKWASTRLTFLKLEDA